MRFILGFILLFAALPAFAATGPAGFAVGFGDGIAGIDFSDGTNRTNVGLIDQNLEVGIHLDDFAFMFTGDFMDIQGSINDFVANGGFKVKWYFTDDWHLSYEMGLSRFQRSSYSGNVTTLTAQTGGYAGAILGWDVYASQGNGPFRLSINIGSRRYDFGAQEVRQGNDVSETDLANHVVGLDFFGYVGLDWYL